LKGFGAANEVEREASWKMKTAKALHIIQISCGQQIQDELFHFETARSAWEYLADKYRDFSNGKLDGLPGTILKCYCYFLPLFFISIYCIYSIYCYTMFINDQE